MIRKRWVIILIALVLFTACRSGSGVEVVPTTTIPGEETESEVCAPDEECGVVTEAAPTEGESEAVEEPTAQPVSETTVEPTAEPTTEPTKEQAENDVTEEDDIPLENPLAERESDWAMGAEDALFTLVEYSDYVCPYCAAVAAPVMDILAAFPDDIRFIYRHFPLTSAPGSANHLAVQAAEAAGLQDRFFDFHNLLFEKQSEWKTVDVEEMQSIFIEYAAALGLDEEQFAKDMDSPEIVAKPVEAYQNAVSIGLQSTPTFFLNGSSFDPGAFSAPIEQWEAFIKANKALASMPQYDMPPMTIDTEKEYQATVKTEKGDIVIELFPKLAPVTVNSFIFLANEGWYDGVTFHRVIADFMAQTGDPSATGVGGPGYTFEDEINPELTFDGPGVVAMANSGVDTNGSQWFITFVATPHLDGKHTIFGKVVEGMDVVMSLTLRDPNTNPDFDGEKILSITIEEK